MKDLGASYPDSSLEPKSLLIRWEYLIAASPEAVQSRHLFTHSFIIIYLFSKLFVQIKCYSYTWQCRQDFYQASNILEQTFILDSSCSLKLHIQVFSLSPRSTCFSLSPLPSPQPRPLSSFIWTTAKIPTSFPSSISPHKHFTHPISNLKIFIFSFHLE